MTNTNYINEISSNIGKVLFAVATGKDMTKLEIRSRTGASMTTVISAVDELAERGLVTFEEIRGAHGGKKRSVINLHPERRAYGISYKSGVLTAAAIDLAGEVREIVRSEREDISPTERVLSLASTLRESAPPPSAIALSLNCEEKEVILSALTERYGAACFSTTNVEGAATLAAWQGEPLPLAAIGLGRKVKGAFLSAEGSRTVDFGTLPSPRILTSDGSIDAALSAERVEEVLRLSDYRGMLFTERGRISEIRDLADYSHALASTLSSLVEIAKVTLSPRRILLFGEYLSSAFFERIRGEREDLVYFRGERDDFARGSALCALIRAIFNPSTQGRKERIIPTKRG